MNTTNENLHKYDSPIDKSWMITEDVPGLQGAIEHKLQLWKERLIDLSQRNRLLSFRQTKSSTLKVISPIPSSIFDHLVKNQKEYFIYVKEEQDIPQAETNNNHVDEVNSVESPRKPDELICEGSHARTARVLYTLRSRAHTELEERGINVLFIALGFLRWTENENSSIQNLSPLVLIPIQLERERAMQRYRLMTVPEEIVINPALSLKLKNDFGIALPEFPENPENFNLGEFISKVTEVTAPLKTWEVQDECQISLFSFLKFMMYKDLEANKDLSLKHRIIGALSGFVSILPDIPLDLVTADTLDEKILPERSFQILDADSSQQEAIAAALAGISFVLQGPPGTGKSQTIANIIAECLAANKKVLFVSEKMAALEVVKRRLDQCGIGSFCLEVHSHKTNKRNVLEDLSNSLDEVHSLRNSEVQFPFQQLYERRKQLNAYVKALHIPRGYLNLSAFRVHGHLARLSEVPDIQGRLQQPFEMSPVKLSSIMQYIDRLIANSAIFREYDRHPWRDTLLTFFSLQKQLDIEKALHSLNETIDKVIALRPQLVSVITEALGTIESTLLQMYSPDLFKLDIESLLQEFVRYQGLRKYLHYFAYRSLLRRICQCTVITSHTNFESILVNLSLASLVCSGHRVLSYNNEAVQNVQNNIITLDFLSNLLGWPQKCTSLFGELTGNSSFCSCINEGGLGDLNAKTRLGLDLLASARSGLELIGTIFPLPNAEIGEYSPLEAIRTWTEKRLNHLSEVAQCLDIRNTLSELKKLGLADFVNEVFRRNIDAQMLWPVFEKYFYKSWLDEVTIHDPVLNSFSSAFHERSIEEFRRLDKKLLEVSRQRIMANLQSHKPSIGFTNKRDFDVGILLREIQKRKRHKSLRRLFSEIPALIQALKPCLLMSPLSVASYLVADKIRFDVLVFDEASQIMPADAIGSILRASQVIVVGDTKQLPPTSFFESIEGDEPEDEAIEDEISLDSIMEEAIAARFPPKTLLWHYRSRDESLIAFSNFYFYRNKLVTFPSAGTSTHPTGIEFVFVDGVYDRSKSRTNRKEALRVAELSYQHYQKYPEHSLGVVAFSLPQADAIDISVEQMRRQDAGFDAWCKANNEEPFFIKNLENVQGDERDVMFFSVGYGPDEKGQITMNFGPLNKSGGPRRLNVAITRAKEHIKLISSLDPLQIDLTRTPSEGVRLLKEYMEVAKHGVEALRKAVTIRADSESESPFEDDVYEVLSAAGLKLQKQIGVSGYRIDLGVVDSLYPGRFLLGIECDGATYHSLKTARDRDRLRQQVLEDLGWKIHRIWSTDWIRDRNKERDKVLTTVAQAKITSHEIKQSPDKSPNNKSITIVDTNKQESISVPSANIEAPDVSSRYPERPETAKESSFDLVDLLTRRQIKFKDKRPQGGALWLIGGNELTPVISELKSRGISFTYLPRGGMASGHRPAWYSHTKT